MQEDALLIKYEYPESRGIDMKMLGESLVGFDRVLHDIIDIAGLTDKVNYRINHVEHGSVEIYSSLHVIFTLPFDNPNDLIDFLKLAAPEMVGGANNFFSSIHDAHRSINDFFDANQFDNNVITGLVVAFIIKAIELGGKIKSGKATKNELEAATTKQVKRLNKMVNEGRYRSAMMPMTEGDVTSIQVTSLVGEQLEAQVYEENVGDYLPDDEKVLPQLANGQRMTLTGQLVTLNSARGDEMYMRIIDVDHKHNLLKCIPSDEFSIEECAEFFKQYVTVEIEVLRSTLYKKPALIIHSMAPHQQKLGV